MSFQGYWRETDSPFPECQPPAETSFKLISAGLSIRMRRIQHKLDPGNQWFNRNFEGTIDRHQKRNLSAGGNKDPLVFSQSCGKHSLLRGKPVWAQTWHFQTQRLHAAAPFGEPGLQAAPVTRLQPIRAVCELVTEPVFQGGWKWVSAGSVSLCRSTVAGSTKHTNFKWDRWGLIAELQIGSNMRWQF